MSDIEADDLDFVERREGDRRRLLPDPKYLLMVFRRRLWVFLLVALGVVAATVVLVRRTTPIYVATSSVLIEPRKTDVIDLGAVAAGLPTDTNVVDTQVQLIASPAVALRVVRSLHLDRDPEFVARGAPMPADHPAAVSAVPMTPAERVALAATMQRVYVRRAGLTYIIDVTAQSTRPEMAQNLANGFAREYLALQTLRKAGANSSAADFVGRRATELRVQAVADDAAVQRYMIAHNLMSAEGATMAEQEVSQLNQQIAQARANLAQERGRLAAAQTQIGRGGGGADINAVLTSDTIRNLRSQEATASADLAKAKARYGDLHPDVVKSRDQLADIRTQITNERQRIISNLEANVRIAESGLGSLASSQARSRGALASNSQAQVGLLELQRKAEASKAIYAAFLQRTKETQATAETPLTDASVSTLARLPDAPSTPNVRLAALAGAVAALLLGLLGVGVAEYLDASMRTREDIENALDVRYLGAVPDLASTTSRRGEREPPHLYVLSHPFSMFVESLRNLAASLTIRGEVHGRVIAITSALPREGKTTLAMSLARTLAMEKRSVILVDADLRRHSLSNALAGNAGERLIPYLDGQMPLADAVVTDFATPLHILPTAGPTGTEAHLTQERVGRMFDELRRAYDIVIVDTAPVLGPAETRVLTKLADSTLLICRWRSTAQKAAQAAIDVLRQSDARVAGAALSMVNVRQYASTGHGDTYGYHKKFTGYYIN